jgi:hypothetical protein
MMAAGQLGDLCQKTESRLSVSFVTDPGEASCSSGDRLDEHRARALVARAPSYRVGPQADRVLVRTAEPKALSAPDPTTHTACFLMIRR